MTLDENSSLFRERLLSKLVARDLEMSLIEITQLREALKDCANARSLEQVRQLVEQTLAARRGES